MSDVNPMTQKAKSLNAISMAQLGNGCGVKTTNFHLIQKETDILSTAYPQWVRRRLFDWKDQGDTFRDGDSFGEYANWFDYTSDKHTDKDKGEYLMWMAGYLAPDALLKLTDDIQKPGCERSGADYLEVKESAGMYPVFARCCPLNPAHGFQDSVPIYSLSDIHRLWKEMMKLDEKGEIILAPYIKSDASSIITPYSLTVGGGHEGATDGHNSIIFSYDSTSNEGYVNSSWGKLPQQAGVSGLVVDEVEEGDGFLVPRMSAEKSKNHPYLEVVTKRHTYSKHLREKYDPKVGNITPYLVQCRGGVKVPSGIKNFLPIDKDGMEVKEIYVPTGKEGLVEWRQFVIDDLSKREGVVVYQPGKTITAHWGVNSMEWGVPYFTSHKPVVGECLFYKDWATEDPYECKLVYVYEGVLAATQPYDIHPDHGLWNEFTPRYREYVNLMLFSLHNYRMQNAELGSRLLGLGIGATMRLLQSACLGEIRHMKKRKNLNRSQIFFNTWKDYNQSQPAMMKAYKGFRDHSWSSGFGGKKWMECAESQITLHHLSQLMFRMMSYDHDSSYDGDRPDLERALADEFNIAVNRAHNNGWVFNKFADKSVFDAASASSVGFAASSTSVLNLFRPFLLNGLRGYEDNHGRHYIMRHHRDIWDKSRRPKAYGVRFDKEVSKYCLYDTAYLDKGGMTVEEFMQSKRPKPPEFYIQGCFRWGITEDDTRDGTSTYNVTLHTQWKNDWHNQGDYSTYDVYLNNYYSQDYLKELVESWEQDNKGPASNGKIKYTSSTSFASTKRYFRMSLFELDGGDKYGDRVYLKAYMEGAEASDLAPFWLKIEGNLPVVKAWRNQNAK